SSAHWQQSTPPASPHRDNHSNQPAQPPRTAPARPLGPLRRPPQRPGRPPPLGATPDGAGPQTGPPAPPRSTPRQGQPAAPQNALLPARAPATHPCQSKEPAAAAPRSARHRVPAAQAAA